VLEGEEGKKYHQSCLKVGRLSEPKIPKENGGVGKEQKRQLSAQSEVLLGWKKGG